ncbi:MAG: hypothetical protein ACRDDZ_02625 [Marinifilaceae bacterium]
MDVKIKRIIGIIVLVGLFICHYYGVTRYSHTHVINGAIVTHSHYYDSHEGTEHHHTSYEVKFLSMFSALNVEKPVELQIPIATITEVKEYVTVSIFSLITGNLKTYKNKGPPTL